MQPLPIFPPHYRAKDHFSPGQRVYLTGLTGAITRATMVSISKDTLNCLREEGNVIDQNRLSPLVISSNELLWLKELLKPCEKMDAGDAFTDLKQCSRKGNQGAIIFLNHLTLIERIHGNRPMYSPSFAQDFIKAILAALF